MKLLITGSAHFSETQINNIEQMGHEVCFLQNESELLPLSYEQVEGVICNGLFLHHPIEKFTSLKYIQLTSAGYDRVSMEYIKEHDIVIHNARGVYSIPMAEFVISSILQVYKYNDFFRINQKKHQWEKHRELIELFGKKVCIIGCGSVGTECAKRFEAFGCEVIGVDLFSKKDNFYKEIVPISELLSIIPKSDIVVLTLPLTKQSKHLMNAETFNAMKRGTVLVNVARGGIIDTEALIQTLNKQSIVAALDVFEDEPLPQNSPLWDMDNVIITPHNSFVSNKNTDRLYQVVIDNLANWSR